MSNTFQKMIINYLTIIFVFYNLLNNINAQHNVVLIIGDDLGTDYFGFYEDYKDTVDVPNLRFLLKKGIRFKNAMSNPVCSSTRAGILTGRYSFRTKVGGIVGGMGGSNSLDTSEISIPRLLKKYNPSIFKANIGKWHLHQPMPASNLLNPLVLGYDHYEGSFIGQITSYTNWTKHTDGVSSNITNYATSENVDNSISWIKKTNNNPFFLWLAFNAPHEPIHLPPSKLHNYSSLSGTTQDINARPKEYYKAMIQALDREIGRFFDSLKILNKFDSTDFIFIGDNGNNPKTAQISEKDRSKGTIYQYGVHVPFIISGPSVINPGRTSNALINTTDLFATILELFNYSNWKSQIPANKPVDSKSILPIIKDQETEIRPWSFCEIFKLTTDSDDGKAIRNLNYKLLRFDDGRQEFYNLKMDSLETYDLLLHSMNQNDVDNYNYLCNEFTNLVGTGTICRQLVNIQNENKADQNIWAFPNPFSTYLHLSVTNPNSYYELRNQIGKIMFSGKQIENSEFSKLSAGFYYLRIINLTERTLKLIKK